MPLLALAIFLVTGAVNLQLPLYATDARDAGLGSGAMSTLLAGYVAALLLTFVLLGGVSDRVGRRPVVVASLAASLGATVLVMAWPGVGGLGGARWLQGLGVGLCMGAATAWMSERSDPVRAARVASWASTAGFGAGALVTAAWLAGMPEGTPGTYPLWALGLALVAVAVASMPEGPPIAPRAPLLRPPEYPVGSGLPAASIAVGWGVSGIVVAVVPGVLDGLELGALAGPTLFAMLGAGFLAQIAARRVSASTSMAVGSAVLPVGTALLSGGVALGSGPLVLVGAAVTGVSTHGYGYLGGLGRVTALSPAPARTVSGYFVAAYLGFGLPAVALGATIDIVGASAGFAALTGVVTLASAGIGASALRTPR